MPNILIGISIILINMIVLYQGARGKGKNLTIVYEATRFKEAGYKVISNFKIEFADRYITNDEFIEIVSSRKRIIEEFSNCVLCLDELHILMDSRSFGKNGNKIISYFIAQTRKIECHILGASQYSGMVDLRFRQQMDAVGYPVFDKYNNYCEIEYYDLDALQNNLHIENALKPSQIIFNAKQVFQYYDTNEVIEY